MAALNDTADKILDLAENFTQMRGFNAFSYRDIQKELGIKTSSIHYHFPTKQGLALKMVERYLVRYRVTLAEIDQADETALKKLQRLGDVFIAATQKGKFCLCGMLAADILTMPQDVAARLREFFDVSENWIAAVMRQGLAENSIRDSVAPENAAAQFLATLEGGMLIARARERAEYLRTLVRELLGRLKS